MIWVVLVSALLSFFLCMATYRIGYKKGYSTGCRNVITQWRKTLDELREWDND